ncbi:MAG: helix-turn-helix transcriptional regulator [Alphaproteobacteria bacterium]|nr:helix-turn-helix transcriptional regulator [Alphaproteobacteria bacterium]
MSYANESIIESLKQQRTHLKMSQKDISRQTNIPQAQISKIENNQTDLRLSSLIHIGNALGLQLIFIPKQTFPAIKSMLKSFGEKDMSPYKQKPMYSLEED